MNNAELIQARRSFQRFQVVEAEARRRLGDIRHDEGIQPGEDVPYSILTDLAVDLLELARFDPFDEPKVDAIADALDVLDAAWRNGA